MYIEDKKVYEAPHAEVKQFLTEDVVTASGLSIDSTDNGNSPVRTFAEFFNF